MKNILVKLGGSVITDINYRAAILKQLVALKKEGYNFVIVHGGGKLISYYLDKLGIESSFYEGLRITSPEAMDVVMMTLVGKVNKDIVRELNVLGLPAVGISGGDASFIQSEKPVFDSGVDLGQVGIPVKINLDLYNCLTDAKYVIVVASVGAGEGGYYNVNADHSAAFIAQEINVDHLIYVSDIDGVFHPETGELFSELTEEKIEKLKHDGVITKGMLPKLYSCLESLKNGVSRVTILNGKTPDSIYNSAVNAKKIGTEILL